MQKDPAKNPFVLPVFHLFHFLSQAQKSAGQQGGTSPGCSTPTPHPQVLVEPTDKYLKQNNAIDIYEDYFAQDTADHSSELGSAIPNPCGWTLGQQGQARKVLLASPFCQHAT